MQGGKHACVCDGEQVTIYNLEAGTAVQNSIKADIAVMHPSKNYLTVKEKNLQGGDFVNVYSVGNFFFAPVFSCFC